ncbi:cobaltochelatase subunit CobN [Acidovorax carolinensis]|uniref:Cobaltochelatase subunit CobN n=1 Tax=Acidovorax carolinensis TaxID=553814 RepID=A0A240UCQ7_9BURK|nr:cobaltochelatase subunit CobN [Acidovorax carolinensis]ART58853.1 cobaltochelatase subunit CobN [Acidovorax carolinensis]
MRAWTLCAALWCLLLVAPQVQAAQSAPQLLWLTSDITTAPRTAMVQRLAAEAGLGLVHIDYPLAGPAVLDAAQAQKLESALAGAALVWVDAPHASVEARLRRMVGAQLDVRAARAPGRVVWVPAGTPAVDLSALEAPARMVAYLQAGGPRNLKNAVALAQAVVRGTALPTVPAPDILPTRGIYHPDAPRLLPNAAALEAWRQGQPALRGLPAVAVLVHRHHFIDGSTEWLDAWLRTFRQQGLFAYAAFGQQVTAQTVAEVLELPSVGGTGPGRLHASALVLHQLVPQAAALQPLLARWGVPLLGTQPYRAGDAAAWEVSDTGLSLSDVPFYLAQPEAVGAIDPVLVAAHGAEGQDFRLIERQAQAVAAKARRLIALQTQPAADKRLVAMVYNYPPGGTNFGASFLNVPRSLEQVSSGLAQAGYRTQQVPEQGWIDGLKPLLAAYYPGADLRALLQSGQAAALPMARYEQHLAMLPKSVRERMNAHWGPPGQSRYVVEWQGEKVFVIPRLQVGHLAVLPQPPREETLRLGQNPFMHKSKAPLSHHYLAVYLWAQREADALIHFGTHGTQEWAGGKARALDVHDDALLPLGDLPVVYPYIVDNLGEALTAKRRGRAVLVSHRTPVFAPAGFEARMAHMHEVMHEWETVDEGPTRRALEKQLVAQFVEHQLHRDLGWSAGRIAADFSGFLEILHPYLDQLAQSSQPKGLAVFGRVPAPEQRRETILQALRKPLIEALGEDIDEAFLIKHDAVRTARPARWLEVALKDAQAASVLDLRPVLPAQAATPGAAVTSDLVRAEDHVPNRAARKPIDTPALLQLAQRAQELERLLATEGELPGLLAALEGRYLPAAYGGDPIRNPDSLPTGRNLTGLDPSRLPTRQAYAVAQTLFNDWFSGYRARHGGQAPQRMALSLWAGETLRHQGIMEAQALVALGMRPVWDDAGRPVRVETISADVLQRPRVDVLMSITGSYRDQFPALMALLDRAVAQAATAEPGNVIARNTEQIGQELRKQGVPRAQAEQLARVRSFGNAVGDYGTGLSDAVQSDGLQTNDARLGQMFLERMSQPYLDGAPVTGVVGGVAAQALGAHLRRTDAAILSRSSHLYAMVSSDDPFQYLGGLSAAARVAGRPQGLELHVAQLQDVGEPSTQTAQRAIALEMQSRYLHPGWLQAQKAEGYAGTLQVLKAVQYAWGWQAVAPDTVRSDHWQSFYDVLVRDKHRLGLPEWLKAHPQAYAQSLERLMQAQRQGFWQADADTQKQLAQMYQELTRVAPLAAELPSVRRWVEHAVQGAAPAPVGVAAATLRLPAAALAQPAPLSADLPAPAPQANLHPVAPDLPAMGVLLERQPEREATVTQTTLLESMAGIVALLVMALVVLAGAAWQARRPSSLSPKPQRAAM